MVSHLGNRLNVFKKIHQDDWNGNIADFLRMDYANPILKAEADEASLNYTPSRQEMWQINKREPPYEELIHTITCNMDRTQTAALFWYEDSIRRLTIREAYLLMGFSEADYISLSEEDAKAPRGVDGSLPTRFARLRANSVLIDKGLDLRSPLYEAFPFTWQPVSGAARDLGPYEYEQAPTAAEQVFLGREAHLSLAVSDGQLTFTVPCDGLARLELYDMQGRRVEQIRRLMVTGGARYCLPLSSAAQPGIYLVRLTVDGRSVQQKVIVR